MNRLTRHHALAFMVLCLLIAAALRFPALSSIPPGLHYDEAANAILAADIGLRGELPVFISSYTGKEVLFFYLAGGLMRLLGESVFALRLTAAFAGVLTVAATYWLGREMLADRRQALLAAALLAVSFWHVLFSRLGFRAVTEPLLQGLALAALFRGLRRDDWRWLVAAGLFLGLTAYTYLAARLFPVLLLLGFLPLLASRPDWRKRWGQLALVALVAAVVLVPLLLYFIQHPDAFWVRISQVAPDAGAASAVAELWAGLLKSWGMFFLQGDPFWRFNLPGRPLFNWVTGGFLVVGWLICLLRYRRYPYDWQRAALLLLLLTPLVMILPTALATNELVPSNLRALGLIPLIFYLPAIGFVILFADIERRFHFPPLNTAVLFTSLLILLSGGLATAQTTFQVWARDPILYFESDGDLVAVAEFLDAQEEDGPTLYVAAPHYKHPTIAFLSERYEQIKWLPESRALVLPSAGAARYVFPHNSPAPAWAVPYLEGAAMREAHDLGFTQGAFRVYDLPEAAPPAIPRPVNADFDRTITLLGVDLETAAAGSTLPLTLFWQVTGPPAADYQPFVQLEDAWGHRWSQVEAFAYPAEQWTPGETIIQQVQVPVPAGAPPGSYRLRIGLFDAGSGARAPRLAADGSYAGDAVFIDDVPVTAGTMPPVLPQPPFAVGEAAAPGLRLEGFERGPAQAATGAPWGFALWWSAAAPLPPLSLQVDLVSSDGVGHTVLQAQPVHDTFPFETWPAPFFVIDRQSLTVPADFAPGQYRVVARLLGEDGETLYEVDLGLLQVEAAERVFELPPFANATTAVFGGEIALPGYDLTAVSDNAAILTLYWQALQTPSADYTVFVHLLHEDGRCCVWQQDSMPRGGAYPTSRWLPGEVVSDPYQIALPPGLPAGSYPLEIGLYLAETGQRLRVETDGAAAGDALLIAPLDVP